MSPTGPSGAARTIPRRRVMSGAAWAIPAIALAAPATAQASSLASDCVLLSLSTTSRVCSPIAASDDYRFEMGVCLASWPDACPAWRALPATAGVLLRRIHLDSGALIDLFVSVAAGTCVTFTFTDPFPLRRMTIDWLTGSPSGGPLQPGEITFDLPVPTSCAG